MLRKIKRKEREKCQFMTLGALLNMVEGLLGAGSVMVCFPTSWLYICGAAKMEMLPNKNVGVNSKSNNEG